MGSLVFGFAPGAFGNQPFRQNESIVEPLRHRLGVLQVGRRVGGVFVQVMHRLVALDAQLIEGVDNFFRREQLVIKQPQHIERRVQPAGVQLPALRQILQHRFAELAQADEDDIGLLRIQRHRRLRKSRQLRGIFKMVKQC